MPYPIDLDQLTALVGGVISAVIAALALTAAWTRDDARRDGALAALALLLRRRTRFRRHPLVAPSARNKRRGHS